MKKLSLVTAITVLGIAGSTVLPVRAADTVQVYDRSKIKGYVIINGKLCDIDFSWKDCPVITPPNGDQPGGEDTDTPDVDQPGGEDTDTPDVELPGGEDTDTPDMERPGGDNSTPDVDRPETNPEERSLAEQVVDLVNAERAKAGVGALTLDKGIESAALLRAKEIETSFSHTRPDGTSFSTVLKEYGITYKGAGENIAWGQRTPEDVMNAWMNSDGHRANILNPKFTKIGVGLYQNAAGRNYWTQLFTY